MNPKRTLALISFLLVAPGLYEWIWGKGKFPVLALLFIPLTLYLLKGRTAAYKILKFLLWLFFTLTLVLFLLLISRVPEMRDLVAEFSMTRTSIPLKMVSLIIQGAVLYYMDTERVKKEYGLK